MAYTPSKLLTFEAFLAQYGDDARYELIDGELCNGETILLVAGVVSSKCQDDYARKVEEYALLGIPEYWIVDFRGLGGWQFIGKPKQPMLTVHTLQDEAYQQQQYRQGETLRSRLLPDLNFRIDDLLSAG